MNKDLQKKLKNALPKGFSSDTITEIFNIIDQVVEVEVKEFKESFNTKVSAFLTENYNILVKSAKEKAEADLSESKQNVLKTVCEAVRPLVSVEAAINEEAIAQHKVLAEQLAEMQGIILEAEESLKSLKEQNKTLVEENANMAKEIKIRNKEFGTKFSQKAVIQAAHLTENTNDPVLNGNNFFLDEEVMSIHKNLD